MMKTLRYVALSAAVLSPLAALAEEEEPAGVRVRTLTSVHPGLPGSGAGPVMIRMPMDPVVMGIPPDVAREVGLSPEQERQVKSMTLQANEDLIPLEADLKRAQLGLERLLAEDAPDEGSVLAQVDSIARAEAAVRKNRLGVMLRIRRYVGPDIWQKLQAAMPTRREVLIHRGKKGELREKLLRMMPEEERRIQERR